MKRLLVAAAAAASLSVAPANAGAQAYNTQQTSVGTTISGVGRASDGSAFTTLAQTFVTPSGYNFCSSSRST